MGVCRGGSIGLGRLLPEVISAVRYCSVSVVLHC